MPKEYQCKDCVYLLVDNRSHTYRREPFYFCKKKGNLHSRNFKIGEGSRILISDKACEYFILNKNQDHS